MNLMPHSGQVSRASSSESGPTCWPMSVCRIAGRFSSCCLTSCCCSAQAWHRWTIFFCPPFSMVVMWTVAGLEQDWHFIPVRSSTPPLMVLRTEPSFQLPDIVADAGRLLVSFLVDRLQQLLAQLNQLRLHLLVLRPTSRHLAGVLGRIAVNVLQQRQQLVAELVVVVGATQPSGVAELDELDAAHRALAVGRRQLVPFVAARHLGPLGTRPSVARRDTCARTSSHRCSSSNWSSPRISVMCKVAALVHFWHFIAAAPRYGPGSDARRRAPVGPLASSWCPSPAPF